MLILSLCLDYISGFFSAAMKGVKAKNSTTEYCAQEKTTTVAIG